ncbi:hypothetical protein N0V94_001128 [Neodidymelliopsis sp. IMI 364377]|nr:hypothetical protein N0V94_001128 [Neodidymelliopsis sp. IMI 364377]
MISKVLIAASALLPALSSAQVISDPGAAGGPLEVVHLYNDQWPTGITVSRSGRMFSNYPAGLDSNNTNTGNVTRYAVAELNSNNTETPYPSLEINNPPGGAINYTTNPPTSANYQNYLIGVQSVVLDPLDRLWILDTGRVQTADGTLLNASPGGTKLICVDITSNSVVKTIVFPSTVAFPDSYVNDVRFDLRASLTASGGGVAYITDSSSEGRNGIIIVDLGTGESWRHLNNIPEVSAERGFVPFVWGQPLYYIPGPNMPLTTVPLGSDGIALSADGEDLYFGPVGGRGLFSIPTKRLRDRSQSSELLAQGAVQNHGQRGVSDGFETDSNGFIYAGNMEQNQLNFFNPANGTISTLVRDPRISWIDTSKSSLSYPTCSSRTG